MIRLTPYTSILLPLLLAACPGKDGLLTDHGGDVPSTSEADDDTESAGTTTADESSGGPTEHAPGNALFGSDAALYNDCSPDSSQGMRVNLGITDAVCQAPWIDNDILMLNLYNVVPPAPLGEYSLDLPNQADAWLDNGDGMPRFAVEGKVIVDSWDPDDVVTGTYDIRFNDDTHLEGSFAGPYCGGDFSCD